MNQLGNFRQVYKVLSRFVPPPRAMRGNYTLDRMRKLMHHLGNPQNSYKVIHVAGTSGKTSTCYYIASLLQASGKKVGLTVSPHIDEVNERVQINLEPLPESKFCSEFDEFLSVIEQSNIIPTYFELLVAFAFWEFARAKVDYAVVEVGLGGLLDGTNVISKADKVCVITDIGLDHTAVLGKTIREIAAQKAGIVQSENQVIMHKQSTEILNIVDQVVSKKQGQLKVVDPQTTDDSENLHGFQKRNWLLGRSVWQYVCERDSLPVLNDQQLMATTKTYIPARMEVVQLQGKTVIMDGAHNAQKMRALASSIAELFPDQKVATLFGLIQSTDRRIRSSLEQLIKITGHIIVTSFETEQDLKRISVRPDKIARISQELGFNEIEILPSPEDALAQLLKRPEEVLLITGSFFLMNHVRPIIFKETR